MAVFGIERCGNEAYWLAIMSCVCSSLCAITSIPINGTVLVAIVKNVKFHTNFHYIIFNIALSDFFIGIILCPLATVLHVNEITKVYADVTLKEHVFRFGLIFFGIVSLLSMTVLSIDRIISLKLAEKYREMRKRYFIIGLIAVWIIAGLLSPVYFFVRFTLHLFIISTAIVFVTFIVMLVTYSLYRDKLKQTFTRNNTLHNHNNTEIKCSACASKRDSITSITQYKVQSIRQKLKKHLQRESNASYISVIQNPEERHLYQIDKRAKNTFFCILVVFIISYMPIVGISFYLHVCDLCPCSRVEILQEIIILFVLASSVFKTLIFLLRLTALRKSCATLFVTEKQVEKRWRAESVPVVKKKESLKEKLIKRRTRSSSEKQHEETSI